MYFSRQEPMNREEYCKQTSKKKRNKRISTDCNQNNKGDKEKHHSGNSAAVTGCPGSIRNPRKRRDFGVFLHRSPGGGDASGSGERKKWLFSADSLGLTTEKLAAGGLRNV